MFLSQEESDEIVNAIIEAEKQTSGEIKVHIEKICTYNDAKKRAEELFDYLKLNETKNKNGVLIYLAFQNRVYAIIGDSGINEKVPKDFWDHAGNILKENLSKGESVKGICLAVKEVGKKLKHYFPYQNDDENEISNEISYGNS